MLWKKWIAAAAAAAAALCLSVPFGFAASAAEVQTGELGENGEFTYTLRGTTAVIRNEDGAQVTLDNVAAIRADIVWGEGTVVYALGEISYQADAASFAVMMAHTSDFNRVRESRYKLYEYGENYTRGAFTGETVTGEELIARGIVAFDNPAREEKYYEITPNRGSGTLSLSGGEYAVMLSDENLYGSGRVWEDVFSLVVADSLDDPILAEVAGTLDVAGEGSWEYLANGKWRFREQGGHLASGWQQIAGKWYYFWPSSEGGEHGMYEMATGWVASMPGGVYNQGEYAGNGGDYYFQEDGSLKTGWVQRDSGWYYLGEDRRYRTGWLQAGGGWYYLSPQDGRMHTGWLWEDGKWYFLGSDGRMYDNGWRPTEPSAEGVVMLGQWEGFHYFRPDGAMATGWQRIGEEWYYFRPDGSRYQGWLSWGGDWYYLESGRMLAGVTTPDGYTVGADGRWVP